MLYRVIILIAIAFVLCLSEMLVMLLEDRPHLPVKEVKIKSEEDVSDLLWEVLVNEYGLSLMRYIFAIADASYKGLTILNILIFIKYVSAGYCLYKFITDVYLKSRARIKHRQMQMEEIQLQIQVVNTKLNLRDNRCTELAEKLRRGAERLRKVQACVRDVIATDAELRQTLKGVSEWQSENAEFEHTMTKEEGQPEHQYILELLKKMKEVQTKKSEMLSENSQSDSINADNYAYSYEPSDIDTTPDCRVKIIKVTNVYKIANLKHYIKRKKLLRATKQAMLKKKMENIKKMLEDWQKTLNTVINSKLAVLDRDSVSTVMASQEAMGDYSKPQSMDSQSDLRNRCSDLCDDNNTKWKPYNSRNSADVCGALQRDMFDQDNGDMSYAAPPAIYEIMRNIPDIKEETETEEEYVCHECHDLIAI